MSTGKAMRRSVALISSALLVGAGATACSSSGSGGGDSTDAVDCQDVTIGVSLSLTGTLAVYGTEEKKAVELAMKQFEEAGTFGDRNVSIEFDDERSDQTGAIEAYERLIHQKGASIIIGAGFSSAMLAAGPVAQDAQVPSVAPATTADAIRDIGEYIFRVGLSDTALLGSAVPAMADHFNAKTAAVIYANDDDAQTNGAKVAQSILKDEGIDVTKVATFSRGQKDISAQATEVVAANPDITFVFGYQEDAGNIIATMARLGYTGGFAGGPGANGNATIEAGGAAAEGLLVPGWWSPDASNEPSQQFVSDFEEAYDASPTGYAAMAYLATEAVANAIGIAECTDGPSLQKALHEVDIPDSLVGDFAFGDDGDAVFTPTLMEVVDGRLVSADEQP